MAKFVRIGKSTTSPVSDTQRKIVNVPVYVDEKGYIQNAGLTFKPIPSLEKGSINGPKAIVLHRTDSSKISSPLKSFESGIGTHFIVDKDGTTYQCASLKKKTYHVGKIKSKCFDGNSCPVDETKKIKGWGWAPTKIYNHEKIKSYPDRYPMNEDSVGIETVAKYNGTFWEDPTPEQTKSIKQLVNILENEYDITDADIYEHDKISYKTEGEGAGLYDGDDSNDRPVSLQH